MMYRAGVAAIGLVALSVAMQAAEPEPLDTAAIESAVRTDAISIPTPGELFAALSKPGKTNWTEQYRGPIPTNYRDRAQIALNLGGLIADGFIAVEAQDSQQVKNIGTDIIKLAKALGVSENVLSRGKSINEFAENNEWSALQEELEATQNEVKTSMQSNQDQDFVILVSLGGWIRGTQVVSGVVAKDYNEAAAKVLRQPALVAFMQKKVKEISPELQDDPLVRAVADELPELQKLVTFPGTGIPAAPEVEQLHAAVTRLTTQIESKPDAK